MSNALVGEGTVRMNFEMRAEALALLDGLEDEKIPRALDYLRRLTREPSVGGGLEDLLEERV